jgi:putative transposase
MKSRQKFASAHDAFHNHFNKERHLTGRDSFKDQRSAALADWKSLMA